MKARVKIAAATTPGGGEMLLCQHDRDFSIQVNGNELMNSRQHESELELARLGCASLTKMSNPSVLIGGLGLGYTLRQTLDMLKAQANVVVAELLSAIVDWNLEFPGELNSHPLNDKRVEIKNGDVIELIANSKNRFDAILLDIDNGPNAVTRRGNYYLYTSEGMASCRRALRKHGCLAIWSSEPNKKFERILLSCNFQVRRFRAPVYKGSKSQSCFIWVASMDKNVLPPGGGEPYLGRKKKLKG